MAELRRELLAAFDAEHREHLEAIRAGLDAAERGAVPDLRDIFRRAHSLKGAARAVDLPAVEDVAHRLEAVLARVAEGALALDAAVIGAVQQGLDGIEGFVAALPPDGAPAATAPPPAAISALDALLGGAGTPPPPAPAHAPPMQPASAPADVPPAVPEAAVEYLRVPASQLESLAVAVQALSEEATRWSERDAALRGMLAELAMVRHGLDAVRRDPGPAAVQAVERGLDQLSRTMATLARQQRADAAGAEAAAQQAREQVEAIALVPAETVLGALGRMARDLARDAGQDVSVRLEGMAIQADRRVLQALKDPVLHLLRNAIGHGVDRPEQRLAQGKPSRAEVVLRLATRGGLLLLTVADDGHGPDLSRIESTAVRQGLLPERAPGAPPPPPDRLLALVFEPGFSTAGSVDRLSGRGMGLSVVAEAARRLRGGALMRARPAGAGTEVEVAVPLSAARQRLLLVDAGGRTYGLPSHGVERLLRLPAGLVESVEGRPVARIAMAGTGVTAPVIAPLVSLATLLGSPDPAIPVEAGHVHAVLLKRGARHCALAVQAAQDVRTLLVDSLDAAALGALGLDVELLGGIAARQGEAPVLVLSPEGLVGRWLRDEGHLGAGRLGLAAPLAEPGARPTVLVVDDSITTRTLEKSILEAQGYRVLLSVDGLDALAVLRGGEALVDLVVADVEMPRMDGFALLQAIKTDPELAPIPVILMTSRAAPEDVRRGLDLGAGAYLAKQKFDQRELLATIGRML
ncbi:response regulator [Roseomonas sp. 573]|uniref:histidine kinase n=2 Tax=Roseomonas haemaphysalidis TaxID=2768162 RepID=A0ABS3KPG6_9PROT|nr:response regulator [Roseomonas haemaphysalidis]MBO1079366.1 response regulator [Roseomonas haemaphysalidis]